MKWALITVIPNTDLKVSKLLSERKHPHHLFRHIDTTTFKPVLSFPGYIFVVRCDCWIISHISDDVIGPVKFGEDIADVPAGTVEQLSRSCENGDDILTIVKSDVGMKPLTKVMVTGEGLLVGQIGVYLRKAYEKGKALVEFTMMGRPTITLVDETKLIVVEETPRRKRYSRGRSQLAALAA